MTTMNKIQMKKITLLCFCAFSFTTVLGLYPDFALAQKLTLPEEKVSKAIPVDRIAAVVNNDVITEIELQQRVHQTALNLRRQDIQLPPMKDLRSQVLERMILERIIEQRAKETGLRIDDQMLNGAIEQIAHNNGIGVAQLEQQLSKDGVSFNSFKTEVRNELMTQRLREREVDDSIQIPESEVDQYIKDQLGPEKRRQFQLARIVLPFPKNATQAQLEALERKANFAFEQAKKGSDFAQLAAKYSATPEAMEGGKLGWVTASRLSPTVLEAVQNKNPGDVIPLRTNNSFQIYKILGIRDPGEIGDQTVEQTHVRHIMMRPTDVTPEAVVIKRLNELKGRLDSDQADFSTLARLHSSDPSGTRGGDLGWLYPGDIPPDMQAAIDKLSKGEISEPVKTPYGWHIFQVLDRRTQKGVNDRLRMQAREALREQKLNDAMLDWERKLRDQAYVEIRIDRPQD